MPLENPLATTIPELNENWPLGSDPKSQGDDHIRQIKDVLKLDAWSKAEGLPIDDLSDVDTTTTAPTNGDLLVWDGTNWVPTAPATVAVPYDIAFYAGFDEVFAAADLIKQRYATLLAPRDFTIEDDIGTIVTAPTGTQGVALDVFVNGTSIFDTKPSFAVTTGTFTGGVITGGSAAVLAGQSVDFDVIQTGDTTTGQGVRYGLVGKPT